MSKKLSERVDGWLNTLTGYGVASKDKTQNFQFVKNNRIDRDTLEALYIDNDLAATIIDRPIQDSLRQGYEIRSDVRDPEKSKEIIDWAETKYDVTNVVFRANVFARLFGGGAVVYGINDGQEFIEPPREGAPIEFLRPADRFRLMSDLWDGDPASITYGIPITYRWQNLIVAPRAVNPTTHQGHIIRLHRERMQIFQGVLSTDTQFIRNGGWGDSVLRRVIDVLTKFDTAWGSIMTLLQDASQGVYKVQNLMELLTSDQEADLRARFRLIDAGKSVFNAIVLDAEGEEYSRVPTPLSEISDVIAKAMLRVASAARMPVTVLFGDSPSGLNASGEGDIRNYYDMIRAQQRFHLGPALAEIYTRLLAQSDSPTNGVVPKDLSIIFPSLWQMSPTEEAALYQMKSQGDASNVGQGILNSLEIAIHRGQFPSEHGFPLINVEDRVEMQEAMTDPADLFGVPDPEPAEPPPPEVPEEEEVEEDEDKDETSN